MSVDSDGIEESFESAARTAVTVAARVGEQLARIHEEHLATARAQSEQAGREYAARLHAERDAARAQLAPVHRDEWWAGADVNAIGAAYTTAKAWEDRDAEAARASYRIRTELRDRYGVDVDAPGDPAAVQAALARATALRIEAEGQRDQGREDVVTGAVLVAEADRIDRRVEDARLADVNGRQEDARFLDGPGLAVPGVDAPREVLERDSARADATRDAGAVVYDSAERRQTMAAGLEGKADAETIRARVVADTSQARHPREAVLTDPSPTATTARPGRSLQRQRGRSGMGR